MGLKKEKNIVSGNMKNEKMLHQSKVKKVSLKNKFDLISL